MPVNHGKMLRLRVPVPTRNLVGGTAQEALWVTIRSLKTFTTRELAIVASTDTLVIQPDVADRYLRRLRDAGYLTLQRDAVAKSDSWRLLPRMNTGPKPPMLVQVSLVFDRNKRTVLDGPHSEEIVL